MSTPGTRWEAYASGPRPAGGRRLAAVAIVLAAVGPGAWALAHASGGCSCGPAIPFGRAQPGFHRIPGPPRRALERLPVPVRLAPALGRPAGLYRGDGHTALILFGARSRDGVFRFTAEPRPPGFDARTIRGMASACDPCSDNRLVVLAPGVHGALLAGGTGPTSVTWIENGMRMVVLGPASAFDAPRAIAAARALARANA